MRDGRTGKLSHFIIIARMIAIRPSRRHLPAQCQPSRIISALASTSRSLKAFNHLRFSCRAASPWAYSDRYREQGHGARNIVAGSAPNTMRRNVRGRAANHSENQRATAWGNQRANRLIFYLSTADDKCPDFAVLCAGHAFLPSVW